jgi:aldose 1-epimerase
MEELAFSDGTVDVVVLPEVGARIHRLRAFGHDLLRAPADPDEHVRDPFFWGAYVMAPWCNRIEPGEVRVGSSRIAVPSNFPDGTAIHGLVYARPWQRRADGTLHVTCDGEGWPWAFEVDLAIRVADRTVRIDMRVSNLSDEPMPAGIGIHPWFRRPLLVAIHGDAVHPSNLATEPLPEPVRGPFDLRRIAEMPPGLDATWTDLADPAVELRWPDLDIRATLRVRPTTAFIVAASPPHLDAIAVEPATHAPQGLRRMLASEPGGLAMLDPGRALDLAVELAFDRGA